MTFPQHVWGFAKTFQYTATVSALV